MDKNSVIGLVLIFVLFFFWSRINKPSAEMVRDQFVQDSIAAAQVIEPSPQSQDTENQTPVETDTSTSFVSNIPEELFSLKNDLISLDFTNKGGMVKKAVLHDFFKLVDDEEKKEIRTPLELLEDESNRFEYLIHLNSGKVVSSQDLMFTTTTSANTLIFTAPIEGSGVLEQSYTLRPDSYIMDYKVILRNVQGIIHRGEDPVALKWVNYLDRLEKNTSFEKLYSTVYFKESDESPSYCSCRADGDETPNNRVDWVSHSNQFFNASIIPEKKFTKGNFQTRMLDDESENLKILQSTVILPYEHTANESFAMQIYVGPNDFEGLALFDNELEYIIPYGSSIFGTINRWIIRPMFNFLSRYIGNMGIVILILTLIVKFLLYPLTYKMLFSQAKMSALKPVLAGMKEKYKDDAQKQQMETMKVYREYGVNPLGGCMPMVLQMPIWFALYRFFPAAIEFRQSPFLWATDLSSYDVFMHLPFDIPFYGAHISLFTLLWAGSTVAYTYYNSQFMDMSANPMMKYMQYLMPFMFLFFFNNYASGLTCYLLFSNMTNVFQTIGTKKFIFDEDKIRAQLNTNKDKPKKKSGFGARLEKAMKEQQKIAAEKNKKKK